MRIARSPYNPIVVPNCLPWRSCVTFNPGAIIDNGTFYLYERASGSLRPFQTSIGLLTSTDGVHFQPALNKPVLTAEMLGYPGGSVQDARVVKIDGQFLMVYAMQPYRFDCWPNGTSVPEYYPNHYPEWEATRTAPMITRSGIAT